MASGKGSTLGEAVADLLKVRRPSRRQQLAYLTSPKTGASLPSVARQLGVRLPTLRGWLSGAHAPSSASQGKLDSLYARFWTLNHHQTTQRSLRIRESTGAMTVQRGSRSEVLRTLLVEKDRRQDWTAVVEASDPDAIQEAFIVNVIAKGPAENAIAYIEFAPGSYTIETT